MKYNNCNDYISTYINYLQGDSLDRESLATIKKHIVSCSTCRNNLNKFTDAIDKHLLDSDLKTTLTCNDINDLASNIYDKFKENMRENIINHLLTCNKCRDKFVNQFIEKLDTDQSILDYKIKIPEIKSPIILLELKREKRKEVKEAIRLAEASIVKIKSDGGIKYALKAQVEKRIETLPPCPSNVKKIIDLINTDADLKYIAKEVSKDVSLSARILQIANSPYYRPNKPIEDIKRALSRIGLTSISRIVSVFGIYSILIKQAGNHLNGYDIPMQIFMDYSTMIAIICMLLAPRYMKKYGIGHEGSYDLDTIAYTAGLVENLGMIVLNHVIDKDMKDQISKSLKQGKEITNIEEALLGITHVEVGAKILKNWNLSDQLIEGMVTHHFTVEQIKNHDNLLSKILYPADTIASELLRPSSKVQPYLNKINLEDDFIELLPFNSRDELNKFYAKTLIPVFDDHEIIYDKNLYIH